MTKTASKIRCKAKLCRPAESAKACSWSFLVLPKNASTKLPVARHDDDRRDLRWLPFSSHLRARRPQKPLAQSGPEAERSRGLTSAPNPSRRTRPMGNSRIELDCGFPLTALLTRQACEELNLREERPYSSDDQSHERPLDLAVRLIRPAALAKVGKVRSNDLRENVISVLKSL